MIPIKCLILLSIIFTGITYAQVSKSLTLGIPIKDKALLPHNYFKIENIPADIKFIKIQTTPTLLDDLFTFVVSNKIEFPTYSTSLFQADSSHINTLIIPSESWLPATSLFITVTPSHIEITDSEFTILATGLDEYRLEIGEEISLIAPAKLSEYYINLPLERNNRILIYAIGSNLKDFKIKYINGAAMEDFEPEFRTGYQMVLDIDAVFEPLLKIEVSTLNEMSLKLGSKVLINLDNNFPLMKEQFELFSQRKCYMLDRTLPPRNLIVNIDSNIQVTVVLRDDKEQTVRSYETLMIDSIKVELTPDINKFCIEDPNADSMTVNLDSFVFQAFDYDLIDKYQKFLMPIFNGYQNRYFVPNGKTIALRRKGFNPDTNTNIELQMYSIQGEPILYSIICEAYPCLYTTKEIDNPTFVEKAIKGMKTANNTMINQPKENENNYASPLKVLSIVTCSTSSNNDCIVYLTMLDDYEVIDLLPQSEIHHKTMALYEKRFNFQSYDININSISFVLNAYNGDVSFEVNPPIDIKGAQMFIGNRKVITFTSSPGIFTFKNFEIIAKGNDFSYYSLNVIYEGSDNIKLHSGQTVLHTVSKASPIKKFMIKNRHYKDKNLFIISLRPLNCFIGYSIGDLKGTISSHHQLLIEKDKIVNQEINIAINFDKYWIETIDGSDLCLYYISGMEIEMDNNALILNEGIEHQIEMIPGKFTKMSYVYPMSYGGINNEQMAINLDFIPNQLTKVDMTIFLEARKSYKKIDTFTFNKPKTIILNEQLKQVCLISSQCNAYITFQPHNVFSNFIYTITAKTFKLAPVFLKKNTIYKDYVRMKSSQYYFADIGENEKGEISINFTKNEGIIYARIIPKDLKEKGDVLYNNIILPHKDMDPALLIPFNPTTNKVIYGIEHTNKCAKGCHLAITINIKEAESSAELIDYSIIIRNINNESLTELKPNEYFHSTLTSKTQYHLYSFKVPYSTDEIMIHFFSDFGLVSIWKDINEGEPLFKISSSKDVLIINKKDIDPTLASLQKITFIMKVEASFIIKRGSEYSLSIGVLYDKNEPLLNNIFDDQNEICIYTASLTPCNLIRRVLSTEKIKNFNIAVDSIDNLLNSYRIHVNYIQAQEFEKSFTKEQLPTDEKHNVSSKDQFHKNILSLQPERVDNYYIVISVYATQAGKALISSTSIAKQDVISLYHDVKVMLNMTTKNLEYLFNMYGSEKYLVTVTLITGKGKLKPRNYNSMLLSQTVMFEIDHTIDGTHKFSITNDSENLCYYIHYVAIDNTLKTSLKQITFGTASQIYLDLNPKLNDYYYVKIDKTTMTSNDDSMNIMLNIKFTEYEKVNYNEESPEDFTIVAYITDQEFIIKKLTSITDALPPEGNIIKGSTYDHFTRTGGFSFPSNLLTGSNEFIYFNIVRSPSNTNTYSRLKPSITTFKYGPTVTGYILPRNKYYHFIMEEGIQSHVFKLTRNSLTEKKMIVELSYCDKDSLTYTIEIDNSIARVSNSDEIAHSDESILGKTIIAITFSGNVQNIKLKIEPKSQAHKALKYLLKYVLRDTEIEKAFRPNGITISTWNDHETTKNGLRTIWKPITSNIQHDYIHQVIPLQFEDDFALRYDSICAISDSDKALWNRETAYQMENQDHIYNLTIKSNDFFKDKAFYSVSVTAMMTLEDEDIIYRYNSDKFQYDHVSLATVYIIIIVISLILIVGFFSVLIFYLIKKKRPQNINLIENIIDMPSTDIEH